MFKEVGLRAVIVGLESCDSNELVDYNKKTNVKINEEAVRILHKYDVECYGTFILGLMGVGVAYKSGFLNTLNKVIAKYLPRRILTFLIVLLGVLMSMFYDVGYRGVSLTGGEPLVSKDWYELIQYAKELGYERREITTNGVLLEDYIKKHGYPTDLTLVKVSLDTTDRQEFYKITKKDDFDKKRFCKTS